jgi:hypothetical protein
MRTMAAGGDGDTGDAERQAMRKRAVGRRARSGVADTDPSIPVLAKVDLSDSGSIIRSPRGSIE